MNTRAIALVIRLLAQGEFKKLALGISYAMYKEVYEGIFLLRVLFRFKNSDSDKWKIRLQTNHPVAYQSPDHRVPWGTRFDNSTNKKFILMMDSVIRNGYKIRNPSFLDLGCSGGRLVQDFKSIDWISVGLEGSDYSLKHGRASWPSLGGKNLFTADITKPFQLRESKKKLKFHVITAWEVLEHIKRRDLPILFRNIVAHLAPQGYFIASTTSIPDIHDGVDLHQTKMSNAAWKRWVTKHVPELEKADIGLRYYQYVRYNRERSFLVYRKK